tara:strand:+ start:130 stop:1062 length:933 start_codon:yes stop_codon:yes gene_type:complete
MKTTYLIDAHSVGYAAQQSARLTVGNREVQAIFGFAKKLNFLIGEKPHARIIVLWDGHSQWRYDLYPQYKEKREMDPKIAKMRAAFRDQKDDIKRVCETLGVGAIYDPGQEADDLAGVLARRLLAKPNNGVILVTGDRDWIQLVRPNCAWMNARDDNYKFVHHETFLDLTGYATPAAFLQGKALQGDNSDNIHPVGMLGEQKAAELLAEFGSVPAFVKAYNGGELAGQKIPKPYRDLAENKPCPKHEHVGRLDVFKRNFKLMNLQTDPTGLQLQVGNPKPDMDAFERLCRELNFQSILQKFDLWAERFSR